MWILIKEMINLELMVKPTFLLVCTSAFCSMIGFFVPLFFLPDFAVLKGIDRSNANFLISIYGKFVRQIYCISANSFRGNYSFLNLALFTVT